MVTVVILGAFGGGMATAFKRLRPLFRERGQINAEVTGRLAESLGGVRIVKSYTAEKREELVFARGAHRLFRNVAQSLTGVSAVTAFSSLVIGAIGIAMMLIGGNSIRNGTMTLGIADHVPLGHRADDDAGDSAGIDRHADHRSVRGTRSHPRNPAHGHRRSGGRRPARAARRARRRRIRRRDVRVQRRRAGAEARLVSRAAGVDDRAGRIERLGQEHAHQPRDGVQSAAAGPRARRRQQPARRQAARLPIEPRRRAAGQLPVRRHHRREHRVRAAACLARGHQAREPHRALRRVHRDIREAVRHDRRRARGPLVGRAAAARVDRARDSREPAGY